MENGFKIRVNTAEGRKMWNFLEISEALQACKRNNKSDHFRARGAFLLQMNGISDLASLHLCFIGEDQFIGGISSLDVNSKTRNYKKEISLVCFCASFEPKLE